MMLWVVVILSLVRVPNIESSSKTSCKGDRDPVPNACLKLIEC